MVHEMELEVDVAILVGIWKLAHDGEMILSSFDDLCPSEARIKVFNEVTTSASNALNKTVSVQLKRCAPGEAVVLRFSRSVGFRQPPFSLRRSAGDFDIQSSKASLRAGKMFS